MYGASSSLFMCFLIFCIEVQCHIIDNPIVTTSLGKIRGTSTLKSRLGKTIYAFRNIRYAKPPINELRFQPPVPIESWTGIYDATQDGVLCPQPQTYGNSSEDCLILNVYTTKLSCNDPHSKRPVIVHIHAGGFYSVGSPSTWAGPDYYLDKDIVLVTFNYRIATLGFLSTGDKHAPGNNGFKDQVELLKWVKNNIAAFGGDPDSVTIVGYSAGGWSNVLHMVSPMSQEILEESDLEEISDVPDEEDPLRDVGPQAGTNEHISQDESVAPVETVRIDPPINFDVLGDKPQDTIGEGQELHDELVVRWTAYLQKGIGKERRTELSNKYGVAKNCPALHPPKLNGEIRAILPEYALKHDKFMSSLQQQMAQGMSALGLGINGLLDNKTDNTALSDLADAAQLFASVYNGISQHRRFKLMGYVNNDCKKIVETAPIGEFLLGNNLRDELKQIEAMKKASQDLLKKKTISQYPPYHDKPSTSRGIYTRPSSLNFQRATFRAKMKDGRDMSRRRGMPDESGRKKIRKYQRRT